MKKLTAGQQARLLASSAYQSLLKKSDGCTASPDFTFRPCCEEHDYHYKTGDIPRKEADARLRECMQSKGYVVLPHVYWLVVRLFGRGFWYGAPHEPPSVNP
jgi:hypothetical protein